MMRFFTVKKLAVVGCVVGLATMQACATESYNLGKEQQEALKKLAVIPCESDQEHTLQMLLDANADVHTSNKVPRDLTIDQHPVDYVVVNFTSTHNLPALEPSTARAYSVGLQVFYKDHANCRVKDPQGNWWLVGLMSSDGTLDYVLEKDTQTQAQYKAEFEKEKESDEWKASTERYERQIAHQKALRAKEKANSPSEENANDN